VGLGLDLSRSLVGLVLLRNIQQHNPNLVNPQLIPRRHLHNLLNSTKPTSERADGIPESEYGMTTIVADMHTRKRLMAEKVLEGGPNRVDNPLGGLARYSGTDLALRVCAHAVDCCDFDQGAGEEFHKHNVQLVYGGGTTGLMGEVARALVSLSGPKIPSALTASTESTTRSAVLPATVEPTWPSVCARMP
jgi:hypothetical protein